MEWHKGMSEAIDYIEDHLAGEIDYSAAARFLGCSSWEFRRLFSLMTGIPLSEYIRLRRLTLAAEDIVESGEKIIDIALRYGYDSQAAFSRAFTRQYGISPSTLRKSAPALQAFPRFSFTNLVEGWYQKMNKFQERAYVVKENGPVYYTQDMDKTLKWFEDVLGWYGDIVERNEKGAGTYGCVYDVPHEIALSHIAPFNGIHMFHGAPKGGVAAFMQVQGIDALHRYVTGNGWSQITDVRQEPWGAKTCEVSTPDGCVLRFFE